MSGRCHVGDQAVLFVDCKDDRGVAVTPTAGSLLIRDPAGTVTPVSFDAFTVEPDGVVGRVEYQHPTFTLPGRYVAHWEFTAGITAAEPLTFVVAPAAVTQ